MYKRLIAVLTIFILFFGYVDSQEKKGGWSNFWKGMKKAFNPCNFEVDKKGGIELIYKIESDNPVVDVDCMMENTLDVIYKRLKKQNVGEPRIYKTENIIILQLPNLLSEKLDSVKKSITYKGDLEFRLVASKKIGNFIDEEEERKIYEKAKSSGSKKLRRYERKLLNKGYAWYKVEDNFPDRYLAKKERLLWLKDGYNWTGKKFEKFYYTYTGQSQKAIGFELKKNYQNVFFSFTKNYRTESLAIVFNKKVTSTPIISDPIPGVGVLVGFPLNQHEKLMDLLQGNVEVKMELLESNLVGASLKKNYKIEKQSGILFKIRLKQDITEKFIYEKLSKSLNAVVRVQKIINKDFNEFYIHTAFKKAGETKKIDRKLKAIYDKIKNLTDKSEFYSRKIERLENSIKALKKRKGKKTIEDVKGSIASSKKQIKNNRDNLVKIYKEVDNLKKEKYNLLRKKGHLSGVIKIKKIVSDSLNLKEKDFLKIWLISEAYVK